MRSRVWVPVLGSVVFLGCALIFPVAEIATYPLDKKKTFEEAQERYTSNIRYGLYDEAARFVEPEHQKSFKQEAARLRDLRFSDFEIESVELDMARTRATAVVVYRGYSLSRPYEQEMRVVQRWRRELPTQNWYVSPDFAGFQSAYDGG